MLFLHPDSPVSVPDVAAAEQLAAAVLDYDENGSPRQAAERLDGMADVLAALAPPQATAPEHARAVAALRDRDPVGYAAAVDDLVGAHLAQRDERRTAALLTELGSDVARAGLDAHRRRHAGPSGPGLVHAVRARCSPSCRRRTGRTSWWWSTPARVGVDRALLGAAAPRMLAVAAPGGPERRNDPARPALPGVGAGDPRPVRRDVGSGRPALTALGRALRRRCRAAQVEQAGA